MSLKEAESKLHLDQYGLDNDALPTYDEAIRGTVFNNCHESGT